MSADLAVEVRLARLAPLEVLPHPRAAVTEDELMRPPAEQTTVWGSITLSRPCACGRMATAPENRDLWADAIGAHQDTPEHRAWRSSVGIRRRIEP